MELINILSILLFVTILPFNKCDDVNGKLIFSHVIFRHGDRTPQKPYANDPWGDLKYWPTGWGQLTNIGKQEQFQLGQWLRKRYASLVNTTYSRNEIYVQSTDVDRTLMSASANMAGFYPPTGDEIWNKNVHWQPVPVHTTKEINDVLSMKRDCPAYNHALAKLRKSEEFVKMDEKNKRIYKYLSKNAGKKVSNLEGVQKIYNCLFIEDLYNKTLPIWTKSIYPNGLKSIAAQSFATKTYTRELARLRVGPLLKEIFDRSINKTISNSYQRSLHMYSAHDSTIANVLNTLKLFDNHSPPYCACIMIELRLLNEIPFVSVFYKNTTEEPKPMFIPDCGTMCPLDVMMKLYKDVLPDDWTNECRMPKLTLGYTIDDNKIKPYLHLWLLTGIAVTAITLIWLIISVVLMKCNRGDYQKTYDKEYQNI